MQVQHTLERVIVVPVNGYVNRLQAWASAAILGAELDVPVQVLWEPEPAAPAEPKSIFSAQQLQRVFISPEHFRSTVGCTPGDLPRYLSVDADRGILTLAGHDRGEQVFIEQLTRELAAANGVRTLVVIAGGKYCLPGSGSFTRQRQVFYANVGWNPKITGLVEANLAGRAPFIALHARGTDRALTAPTRHQLRTSVDAVRAAFPDHDLFVAADSKDSVDAWIGWASHQALRAWSQAQANRDRSSGDAGVDAIVDWLLLGKARAGVGAMASSFAFEAAVAGGHPDDWILLEASPARQRVRTAGTHAHNALTMPARRRRARLTTRGEGT